MGIFLARLKSLGREDFKIDECYIVPLNFGGASHAMFIIYYFNAYCLCGNHNMYMVFSEKRYAERSKKIREMETEKG